jgi:small subunit ribosomal protein S20
VPNKVSAEKRVRQAAKARERNRAARSAMRKIIKDVRTVTDVAAPSAAAVETVTPKLVAAQRSLGKAAKTGLIKKNKAARVTSRLALAVNKARAQAK